MKNKKIKILLLNCPYTEPIIRDNYCCFTSKSDYLWPPVDLLYLSGILDGKETEIKVIDAVVDKRNWTDVGAFVTGFNPEIIIALTGTVSYKKDLTGLKQFAGRRIYLMGNTPCFRPGFFLKEYPYISGIIHNFFDREIKDFMTGKSKECGSVSYRGKNGTAVIGRVNNFRLMSTVSIPAAPKYDLFPLEKYSTPIIRKTPMVTAMTSFGCPFHCKFCIASALSYYRRDLKDVKRELDAIKKSGIREIFFEDSTFNAYLPYTEAICRLMIKNRYHFSWSANIHSFNLNKQLLTLMKKAGCHTAQIGVESGNPDTLLEYAPSKNVNRLNEAFKLCKEAGIRTLGYFIIGFPNETEKKAGNTIDFAKKLNPDFASFSVLTPDYGTKLYDEVLAKKMISEKRVMSFDSSDRAIINNPAFPRVKQDKMVKQAYREFYFRPNKLISFASDTKNLPRYIKNGLRLIFKKII